MLAAWNDGILAICIFKVLGYVGGGFGELCVNYVMICVKIEDFWRSSRWSAKWVEEDIGRTLDGHWADKRLALEIVFCYNVNKKRKITSMSETVKVGFRVNKELKMEAEKVFKQMGMTTTAAIGVFFAQCVREQRLPFQPGATQAEVEENGFDALLDEADKILGDEKTTTGFVGFEELEIAEK